jgi:hypothetical protein
MPNKSTLDNFEPLHLREANEKLDKHVLSANIHKKTNDAYKKDIFKESLWSKIKGLFKS